MKVVIATPLYPPEQGEPATYIRQLALQLVAAGHVVTVVAYANQAEPTPGVRVVTVSKRMPLLLRLVAFAWKLLLASSGASAIYSQRALAAGVPSTFVGRLRRIPVTINFVADELAGVPGPRLRSQSATLRAAARVVVPSRFMERVCRERYGVAPEKIAVCPPPLSPDQVLPFQPQRDPKLTVVPPHSSFAAVRYAMDNLANGRRLRVMGEYTDDGAAAKNPSVEFLGRVSAAEEWYLLRQAATCVVDLDDEAGEAAARAGAAAGCSVAATDGSADFLPAPSWGDYVPTLVKLLA